ncbi:type I restriction enzyme HsdR N-terminal domain-containing protein [Streptosporangium sp. NBC_01756]|uniref:type I restriction enzyme HsdR N-terminal domain-containing protein n=1 Tax=Streptosporangium sp. NBC_01756 TaxID=2975950 RepID=UPI002DD7D20F|nr:type I restriction enzyme HsdR N-terminal domain-containing protein [Streptosporangium sp. NBC_01756]WSC90419.1 type I restriction enzyme HsdR N-terminal domain-containing protein [Streptosporangium sp. NBC_01756]
MSEQSAQVIVGEAQVSNPPDTVKKTDSSGGKKPPAARAVPKWETDARDRVRAAVRRYSKPLADLVARDANEGDTRLLITDFLCEGLGYDKYEDLTTEYQVKGEFADYGIRIDKQLVAFIEVKRCSQKLNTKHLRQVQMYAVNEGVEWMILSNGQVWQAYHMTAGLPVVIDLALEVDLLGDASLATKVDGLFYLSKEAFKRRLMDDLWRARAATSPKSLAQVLPSEVVVDAMRKELRRQTNYNADSAEIHRALRDEVLRAGILS